MGKIYQPEVAARAIVRAALKPEREAYVGWPAVQAVLGNMFIPGLLDRYLATKAWEGQLSSEPLEPQHEDNLYSALHRDFGAHGRFDAETHPSSWQYRAAHHPGLIWLVAGATALALWSASRGLRR